MLYIGTASVLLLWTALRCPIRTGRKTAVAFHRFHTGRVVPRYAQALHSSDVAGGSVNTFYQISLATIGLAHVGIAPIRVRPIILANKPAGDPTDRKSVGEARRGGGG